ncbi:dTDP-4-dehydrorhamnose reductase [Alteraurantiacibacter aestuarii]|uniref:dTDP-4-dehydrorhamnose reductase n=1 Tax=Alteraurantiacibacter aestuarii TaxID=650004 RepID=A0A844ZKY0_9SPHN|nr:dTDP-4-dehydrorhamnose reductase [Alteraurantiacibacter aestuarii]MXO88428.1 dTDP-4-dehydrorhamnose reductase [Alteraurantiacibacter aestuarii]
MKVLVTGAGGQLGRALIASAPEGCELEAIDIADLDLTDAEAIRARIMTGRPDLVMNAAAYTAVDKAESEEDLALAINGTAVAAMASALAETGGRLVHVSTDFVFDGTSSRAYRPEDSPAPISAYGRTKLTGEQAAADSGALIVRTAWVYTAGGANFVRTMIRLMREKDELRVVADQIGTPTWAPGLATVLWGLAAQGASGIYHHSDAGVASWYDFAVAIQDEALAAGLLDKAIPLHPITTADYPTPAVRPAFSLLDCSATRALLQDGWTHWRHNLRTMLKEEKALG